MSAHSSRLELRIDIFERKGQRALTLPSLSPPALVAAVLQEFGELEYLGSDAGMYVLFKANDKQPLDDALPIGQQIQANERLILAERFAPLPQGTQRPTRPTYLRDQATGTVYPLHWQPAVIGRPDEHQEHHDWLAVDLADHITGLRVSRRHAQIVEADGQLYIERLSENPTLVKDHQGALTPVGSERQPLHHGDTIILERSQVALKVIVRDEEPSE